MNEDQVNEFWQAHPCGDSLVGGLDKLNKDYKVFFEKYDAFRYGEYPELLKLLENMGFNNKTVLEVGLGQGADSEQIILRGGLWNGLDLTAESVERVRTRLELHELPYGEVKQGTVLDIPFPDNTFDKIYSCGVLHHVPEVKKAGQEIHRVLRESGELIIMVYAKISVNYLVSIFVLRRLLLAGAFVTGMKGSDGSKLALHIENAKKYGLINYLKMKNFIHRNTDGPLNPYAKVYTLEEVRQDFPDFEIIKSYKNFMHAPPIPVHGFPGGNLFGWCLWVHLKPRK